MRPAALASCAAHAFDALRWFTVTAPPQTRDRATRPASVVGGLRANNLGPFLWSCWRFGSFPDDEAHFREALQRGLDVAMNVRPGFGEQQRDGLNHLVDRRRTIAELPERDGSVVQ